MRAGLVFEAVSREGSRWRDGGGDGDGDGDGRPPLLTNTFPFILWSNQTNPIQRFMAALNQVDTDANAAEAASDSHPDETRQ